MTSPPPQPLFGRIRLDQVIGGWSSSCPLNPRLLAGELAALLRTIGPTEQVIDTGTASVVLFDAASGSGALTIGAMVAYFERYSAVGRAGSIETTVGIARAGAVYLAKPWIERLEIEAEARASTAVGLQQAHPAPRSSGGALPAGQRQPPKSGSDPECLALHQAQQRQEGEQRATEQLEASEQRALLAEREKTKLLAKIQALEHSRQQALDEAEQERRNASEERRARTLAEDLMREHAGIIEFMNPDNPLSPVEGPRMVAAWCELTNGGTENIVSSRGVGLTELCRDWLNQHHGPPAEVTVKRFGWALTCPARKKGGAVAKHRPEKG